MGDADMGGPQTPQLLRTGWLFPYEAAERVGLSQHTVENYVNTGVIPGAQVQLGRVTFWFIHEQDLAAYQEERDRKRGRAARARAGGA